MIGHNMVCVNIYYDGLNSAKGVVRTSPNGAIINYGRGR